MRTISVCTFPQMLHSKAVTDSIPENAWLHQMRRVAWVLLLILVVLSVSVVLPVRSLPAVTVTLHPQGRGIGEEVKYWLRLITLFPITGVISPPGDTFCGTRLWPWEGG